MNEGASFQELGEHKSTDAGGGSCLNRVQCLCLWLQAACVLSSFVARLCHQPWYFWPALVQIAIGIGPLMKMCYIAIRRYPVFETSVGFFWLCAV